MVIVPLISVFLQTLPAVLSDAHSHNDYNRRRPLLDALERGYASIEADICLVNGDLLVAHEVKNAVPERTLKKLYLDPLKKWIDEHAGRAIKGEVPLQLLIDIKTDANVTYDVLKIQLENYASLIRAQQEVTEMGPPVVVVLSGNRPITRVTSEKEPLMRIDGRIEDLAGTINNQLIPIISADWFTSIGWLGVGSMSREQSLRLKDLVQRTHASGRKLRFWGVPAGEKAWTILFNADVDYLGTDDLDRLREFLLRNPHKRPLH